MLPYSGKVSRISRITGYLRKYVLFFVDKDRAIAPNRENIFREMLYLTHSRNLLLYLCYTVFLLRKIELIISPHYCKAGNFGGSKFWRMTQILRMANLILASSASLIYYRNRKSRFWRMLDDSPIRQSFLPPKLPLYGTTLF